MLRRRGHSDVTEIDVGERLTIGSVTVDATFAAHDGGRGPLGARGSALGFVLAGSRRLYFAGDTDLFDGMEELGEGLDLALVPIWGWGPSLGSGHLDPEGAARAVALLKPRIAVPIHWGTYHPVYLGLRAVPAFLRHPPLRFVEAVAVSAPESRSASSSPGRRWSSEARSRSLIRGPSPARVRDDAPMSAIAARLIRAASGAWTAYFNAAGSQRAAAISYHVLFSLVPFVALFVAIGELVLSEQTQGRVAQWLTEALPLPEGVQEGVENVIADAGPAASIAGIVALLGLLWGATGMMTSIRSAFKAIWADPEGDPYLRGKLLDLALVLGAGVVAVSAFGLTVIAQFVASASTELVAELGGRDDAGAIAGRLAQLGGSLALTFVAFLLLYRVAPPVPTRMRETAPGALVATVGFHAANAGFSLYLAHIADFDDVYGPLGAVLAFVFLVYVTATVLLAGACFAVAWPASVRAAEAVEAAEASSPLHRRLLRAARGLVVRD